MVENMLFNAECIDLAFEHEFDVASDNAPHHSDLADDVPHDNDNYMQEAIQHIREYQQGLYQNQHVSFSSLCVCGKQ